MKNNLFLLLLIITPTCLFGQKEEKRLSIELTYGYDLSTKSSYKRKVIIDSRTIGIIHNIRLGINIGYSLSPKFYLLGGAKVNMNSITYVNDEDGNLLSKVFFSQKVQRDFYLVLPFRGRYFIAFEESSRWFIEGGFSLYHYITSYRKLEKDYKKDVDYYPQKYSLNFSLGKEWNRKNNRKLAFQLIARFQLNESLNSNLPNVKPSPSHRYNHIGFEMRHSF